MFKKCLKLIKGSALLLAILAIASCSMTDSGSTDNEQITTRSVNNSIIHIEAEDYSNYYDTTHGNSGGKYRNDNVDIQDCSEGGYNVGWIDTGEWLEYVVDIPENGSYKVIYRTANPYDLGGIQLIVNGQTLATTDLTDGDHWQDWKSDEDTLTLNSGIQTIRLFASGRSFNINWFQLIKTDKNQIQYPATNPDNWSPGAGWNLAWSDEFNNGIFDTSTWTRQVMYDPPNNEWQQYLNSSDYAWEEGGYMILKAVWRGEYHGDNRYYSARVISNPGGQSGADSYVTGKTFKYGKIAARIQLPYGKGIWPAFWMLGDNITETGGDTNWPQCGEIDILETGGKDDPNFGGGTVHGTIHRDPGSEDSPHWYNLYTEAGKKTLSNNQLFAEQFHVFEVEWDENQIIWKLDGVQFGNALSISGSGENEFHKDFYALFNIAVSGWFTQNPDESTNFSQYMYIDWIRHYTK